MGVIYKITASNNKIYIGQTINSVDKRWKEHVYDAFDPMKNRCKLLNAHIRKYGPETFQIETILECDDSLLNNYEQHYIAQYNSLAPNGLNLKHGGGSKGKHLEVTKQNIRNALLGKPKSFEQKIKLSYTKKSNKELPMYLIELKQNEHVIGYRVCNHPNQGEKKFANCNISLPENLENAKAHLAYLNSLKEPLIPKKSNQEKYIAKFKNGYRVRYMGCEKSFTSKSDENYARALAFLNTIKAKECVQRLDDSG